MEPNPGTIDLSEVTLTFSLFPGTSLPDTVGEMRHHIMIGNIGSAVTVSLDDAFTAEGIDIAGLALLATVARSEDGSSITTKDSLGKVTTHTEDEFLALQTKWLGPFVDGIGVARGYLSFSAIDGDGLRRTHKIPFQTPVRLYNENRSGVTRYPSFAYTAALRTSGTDYVVRVPISHELKTGESDRFTLSLGVRRSSRHRLVVSVRDIARTTTATQEIDLAVFLPFSVTSVLDSRLPKDDA